MEIDISLITCPDCNIVFQYYDFLSHNSNNCNGNNMDDDGDDADDEDDEDDRDDADDVDDGDHRDNRLFRLNGLNDFGNYIDLYNPMINRNFQNNDTNTNTNNAIHNLTNQISSMTLSMNVILPCGLDKNQLQNNSTQIQCQQRSDCSICLVSYPENTTFYLMTCNHSFCIECCEKWFSSNVSCPLCRQVFTL